jgi:hypothetical protein
MGKDVIFFSSIAMAIAMKFTGSRIFYSGGIGWKTKYQQNLRFYDQECIE